MVAIPALLEDLGPLLAFGLALSLAYSLYLMARIIGGIVNLAVPSIPFIGRLLETPVSRLTQWISNEAGKAVTYLEGRTVKFMYGLAAEIRWMGHEIAQGAKATLALTWHVATLPTRAEGQAVARAVAIIHREERLAVRDIRRAIGAAEATAGSVAPGVYPRLGRLEHDVTVTLPREIGNLRDAVKRVEDGAIRTWEWVRSHPYSVGATAFAGAVAWALSRLGLSGLRCNALRGALRRRGCGLWRGLEDILGLLFDGAVLLSLCEILPEAEKLFATFEGPLVGLISGAANDVCARPPSGWNVLKPPPFSPVPSSEIIPTL